jgi:hypothetical protein
MVDVNFGVGYGGTADGGEAAGRMKQNRCELVGDALQAYLIGLQIRLREERDRQGYRKQPQNTGEIKGWEAEAAWPAE